MFCRPPDSRDKGQMDRMKAKMEATNEKSDAKNVFFGSTEPRCYPERQFGGRQTDRQTDRQADRQADMQTDR